MDLKRRVRPNSDQPSKRVSGHALQVGSRVTIAEPKIAQVPDPNTAKPWYKHWWGVLVALAIWPFFATWFVWKKTKWNKVGKLGATAVVLTGVVLEFVAMAAITPPSVTVNSSTAATKDSQYKLTADVYPYDSTVTVNGKQTSLGDQGKLNTNVSLNEGDNQITIVATSAKKVTQEVFTIHRYTTAELAAQAKKLAAEKAKAAEKAAAALNVAEAKAAANKAAVLAAETKASPSPSAKPTSTPKPPTPTPRQPAKATQHTPVYVAPATPTPAPAAPVTTPQGCTPLSNKGTCYEPGEYCRNSDHGASGIAGDGEHIACESNNGWRWEPN